MSDDQELELGDENPDTSTDFVDFVDVVEGKAGWFYRSMSDNNEILNISETYDDKSGATDAAGSVAEQLGVPLKIMGEDVTNDD